MKETNTIEKRIQHVLYVLFSYHCIPFRMLACMPVNILSIIISVFHIAFINFAHYKGSICLE